MNHIFEEAYSGLNIIVERYNLLCCVHVFVILLLKYVYKVKYERSEWKQEMSLKKTNGVGLKKEENITQG